RQRKARDRTRDRDARRRRHSGARPEREGGARRGDGGHAARRRRRARLQSACRREQREPSRKVRVAIDQDQARLLGLSSQALSGFLNTIMTGAPITQVRDDIYLVDVVARAQDEQRVSLSTLRALQVPLPNGRTVPLSQIATFDFDQEYP